MSNKKAMIESLTNAGITNVPLELAPVLKALAEAASDIADRNPQNLRYLTKEERKVTPDLAVVDEVDIDIVVQGKVIKLRRADTSKPAVVIPNGLSDKITTAAIPWQWVSGILYQTIISMLDGDPEYAKTIAAFINHEIDEASVITESGSMKIDTKSLPQPQNAIEVAQFLDSLKREFKSKSKGSPRVNVEAIVEPMSAEPRTTRHLPSVDEIITPDVEKKTGKIPSPVASISSSPEITTTTQEGTGGASATILYSADDAPSTPSSIVQEMESHLMEIKANLDTDDLILNIIEQNPNCTIGQLRKYIEASPQNPDEKYWRLRLDSLIENGTIHKEGARRATRYSLANDAVVGDAE
jgi:hypothetical protein